MKFKVKFRPYPAGIGESKLDEVWELAGGSLEEVLEHFYARPDYDPKWRIVDAQNSTDQDGIVRPEAGPDEHAEQPIPGSVYSGPRTE